VVVDADGVNDDEIVSGTAFKLPFVFTCSLELERQREGEERVCDV
jgi:hypothetical protein